MNTGDSVEVKKVMDAIETAIALGRMDAASCFTGMKNLVQTMDRSINDPVIGYSPLAERMCARAAGITSSADHAEADATGWGERAGRAAVAAMILINEPCTMECARSVASAFLLEEPPDLRAWGSVTQRLIRAGIIERVGYAPAASSNGSPKPLYRRLP